MRSQRGDDASPLGLWFYVLAGGLAGGLATYLIWAASFQWFFADDFVFLRLAQQNRSWWEVLLPIRGRLWWSYRPLTTDVFFATAHAVFGLQPLGYLLTSQVVHLATGVVVYRVCRQLRLSVPAAIAAGIFSRFRYPSISEILWASAFQYTGAAFFSTLSVSLFLDWVRLSKCRAYFAASLSFVLALLSNEWTVGMPVVPALATVFLRRPSHSAWRSAWRSLLEVLPFVLMAAAFLVARFFVFEPPAMKAPPVYNLKLGLNVPHNLWVLAQASLGGRLQTAVFFLPLVIPLALATSRRSELPPRIWAALKLVGSFSLAWALTVSLPVAMLGFAHPRLAIPSEVPLSILWGGAVDVCRRSLVPYRKVFDLLLVAALVAAVPYGTLRNAVLTPRGQLAKTLVRQLGDRETEVPAGARVIVLFGGEGMGTRRDAERIRVETFGGAALRVWYPQKALTLEIHEATKPAQPDAKNRPIVLLMVTPAGGIERVDTNSTERPPVRR